MKQLHRVDRNYVIIYGKATSHNIEIVNFILAFYGDAISLCGYFF